MRIALVHPYLWPRVRRGGERYLDDLAWYLVRAGHSVDVIANAAGAPPAVHGARVRRVPLLRSGRLSARGLTEAETFAVAALVPLLRRRYDVVHALTPAAALAAGLAGQRTVYTLLGHPSREVLASRVARSLAGAAVRRADVVTALSAGSAEALATTLGRRAEVLSPGVRLDRFTPELRARTGPPRVLFSSALSLPQKGLDLLLAATARLLDTIPDLRVVLSGPGDHAWALAVLGSDAARVIPALDPIGAGTPDDVPERYRRASITVLPSRDDTFGLVLAESLACGTPVVCTTAGGMTEIVDRPEVGRAVPYGDVPALAAAVEETLALAREDKTPARCRAHAARWGWEETIGPAHEALYRKAARG